MGTHSPRRTSCSKGGRRLAICMGRGARGGIVRGQNRGQRTAPELSRIREGGDLAPDGEGSHGPPQAEFRSVAQPYKYAQAKFPSTGGQVCQASGPFQILSAESWLRHSPARHRTIAHSRTVPAIFSAPFTPLGPSRAHSRLQEYTRT